MSLGPVDIRSNSLLKNTSKMGLGVSFLPPLKPNSSLIPSHLLECHHHTPKSFGKKSRKPPGKLPFKKELLFPST